MLLRGCFSYQSAPQSDQFAGEGVLLSNTFANWEAAICFLSLSAEKSKVYLIWKMESRSGTRMTIALHLSSFPYAPRNLAFCLSPLPKLSLPSPHLEQQCFRQTGPPEALLSQAWSDVTEDAHPAHCYCQSPHRTPTLVAGEEGLNRGQHIQFCSADFRAQNKFLWSMGHWAKISMCGFLLHVPCCTYKPIGWAGRSGWLQQCPDPLFCSSLKGHPPSVSLAVLGRASAVTISNWYYFLSVYIFTSVENI